MHRPLLVLALGAFAASSSAAQRAALSAGGPLIAGSAHPFELSAPELPGAPYAAALSLSVLPGIEVGSTWIGLAPDELFFASLGAVGGALDGAGRAGFDVAVPRDAALEGLAVSFAAVVLDAGAPDGIGAVSNTLTRRVRLVPPAYDFAAVDQVLAGFSDGWFFNDGIAFVFVQNGELVHVSSFGDLAPDTRVPYASATKWLSGAALATLVDAGELSLDDPLAEYLPLFLGPKAEITFRQAFAHTSGLPGGWGCVSDTASTLQACAFSIAFAPLNGAPGELFDYGGPSMHAAGAAIENLTGMGYEAWFQTALGEPLGLGSVAYDGFGATLNPQVAAGAKGTVLDYVPLLVAMLDGGSAGGVPALSTRAVLDVLAEQTGGVPVLSTPFTEALGYGVGCWVEALDEAGRPSRLSSPGAFGAYPWVDLEHGYGAFVLMLRNTTDGMAVVEAIRPLLEQLADRG